VLRERYNFVFFCVLLTSLELGWWYTGIVAALRRLRPEHGEFGASLDDTARLCHKAEQPTNILSKCLFY
jgi:hypothetical protein